MHVGEDVGCAQKIPCCLHSQHLPKFVETTLLFLLFAGAAFNTRDSRLERSRLDCSRLDYSTGFDAGSRLPFVDVLVVALELVLTRKAVVPTVLAPKHGTRILEFLGACAMLDCVMAYEIGPPFACEWTDQLYAAECFAARFVEMASFV